MKRIFALLLSACCLTSGMAFNQAQQLFLLCVMNAPPTPPLPYDAEVEWILSDGTSYVQLPDRTSLTGTTFSDFRGRLDAKFLVSKSGISLQTILALSGGRVVRVFGTGAKFAVQILFPTTGNVGTSVVPLDSVVEVSVVVNADGGFYYINGTLIDSKPRSAWTDAIKGAYMAPLRILADGTQSATGWVDGSFYRPCTVARLYWVKYYDGSGNLVFDLQPVRFTNELGQSEGAMYDRVSGEIFRNAGTGAFTIGPDK